MKRNLILINVDATIFDVVDPIHDAYARLAMETAIQLPASFLKRIVDARGTSREKLDREFPALANLHSEAKHLYLAQIKRKIEDHTILRPDARDFLQSLTERRFEYGFVSSLPRDLLDTLVSMHTFMHPVVSVVQSEVNEGKPEPDLYLKACRKAALHPNKVLVIENSVLGVTSAFLANTRVVYLESVFERNEEEYAYSFQEFSSLNEIDAFLDHCMEAENPFLLRFET
ncbi:MAG: HAD family hydrolase [Erysipelotrichaceae bacterium]